MTDLFGLWGGRWPGGWCTFETARTRIAPGPTCEVLHWGYVGTREEAERGRAQFITEGNDPALYTVILFDPDKEPAADRQYRPSPAQLAALRMIAAGERGWNFHLKVRRATYISLFDHGLIMRDSRDETSGDLRLTRFGQERLK